MIRPGSGLTHGLHIVLLYTSVSAKFYGLSWILINTSFRTHNSLAKDRYALASRTSPLG